MRFLKKKIRNNQKITLVISDLHLSAGSLIEGRRNYLENFYSDFELCDFFQFYSSGDYENQEVEVIINGDFLDFLAVPYVNFFDDEFWSEKSSLAKLEMIIEAHREVFEGIKVFLSRPKKKITYLVGNHDAEIIHEAVQKRVKDVLTTSESDIDKSFQILIDGDNYFPHKKICIQHGHNFERAHRFETKKSLQKDNKNENHFIAPWGSYYVMRVVNHFKKERSFIDSIRPIKSFLIYGIIFDTFFTLRFIFANIHYAVMVFIIHYLKRFGLVEGSKRVMQELELFQDFSSYVQNFFELNKDIDVFVVGHTHEAEITSYAGNKVFINTGTWTKMFNLDFAKRQEGLKLTYAYFSTEEEKLLSSELYIWRGKNHLPYIEF